MKYLEIAFSLPVDSLFTYTADDEAVCSTGYRVSAQFGGRKMTGYVISVSADKPDVSFSIKPVLRVIDSEPLFGRKEIGLAEWMSHFYICSFGEALAVQLPGGRREKSTPALAPPDEISDKPIPFEALSEAQKSAVRSINSGEHDLCYIYGVTGSGKTEVFLQAAEHVISRGKSVIYLVPEISLTHQLAQQVSSRFGNKTAVLHSGLTPSQRLSEWMKIRKGEVSLAIGARSAVFAPFEQLGLIIIDEEHENSYKSGSHPRYHARQIAFKRAREHGAVLVMGSATPSLEAWNLREEQRLFWMHLPQRVSGGSMPQISVIDLKQEPGPISETLLAQMRSTIARGKQVILFLNRRGFSYFFHCRSCGFEMQCPHCSVSLTYHRAGNRMVCHYCGFSRKPVDVCPSCGSLDVGYSGFGTEMIETAVRSYFPDKRIERLDTDSVRKKTHLQSVLKDVKSGAVDILLGTQMVAKGLNFTGVELVGIVLADSGLHIPDFRAHERTFSLITQVAGRAGRYSNAGRVIVQTYLPENTAVAHAVMQELEAFYQEELENRNALGFPPKSRMCRIVFRGKNREMTESGCESAAALLETMRNSDDRFRQLEQLGPAECPISRISGSWRYQLILRSSSMPVLLAAAHHIRKQLKLHRSIYMEIDVDPVSLM